MLQRGDSYALAHTQMAQALYYAKWNLRLTALSVLSTTLNYVCVMICVGHFWGKVKVARYAFSHDLITWQVSPVAPYTIRSEREDGSVVR